MSSRSFDKLVEEIGGMTVLELNDFVKFLEEKFGVSAAAMAVAGTARGWQVKSWDVRWTPRWSGSPL